VRLAEVESEITSRGASELSREVAGLRDQLARQFDTQENLKPLILASESSELANERFRRVLCVSLYTSIEDTEITEAVERVTRELMEAVGLEIVHAEPSQIGSCSRKLWFRTKEELSKPESRRLRRSASQAEWHRGTICSFCDFTPNPRKSPAQAAVLRKHRPSACSGLLGAVSSTPRRHASTEHRGPRLRRRPRTFRSSPSSRAGSG
jgi:hypothetical protein